MCEMCNCSSQTYNPALNQLGRKPVESWSSVLTTNMPKNYLFIYQSFLGMFGVSSELPVSKTTGRQARISPGEWDLCCHHYTVRHCLDCSMEISEVSLLSLLRLAHCIAPFKSTSNSISNLARVCLFSSTRKLAENQKSVGNQASITDSALILWISYFMWSCRGSIWWSKKGRNIFGQWLFSGFALHKWSYGSEELTSFCLSAEE